MIKKIAFTNYKAFKEREEIDLRHVTLILGKNSSGKTSILKLFPMFANMLRGDIQQPLLLVNEGLSLGSDYRDLFHNMSQLLSPYGMVLLLLLLTMIKKLISRR